MTINKINNKCYIGKDVKNKKSYLGSGKALKNAIKKYGKENFEKIILEFCENKKHLSEREKFWISFYDAVYSKNFYNLLEGGIGGAVVGHKVTKETREKISKKNSGRKQPIDAVKKFYKPILQYNYEGNFIKEFESRKFAEEFVGGRIGKTGTEQNPELSHGFFWIYKKGKIKNKIKVSNYYVYMRKVGKFDEKNNLLKEYDNLSLAIKENKNDHIREVCFGTRKKACGFIWKFLN